MLTSQFFATSRWFAASLLLSGLGHAQAQWQPTFSGLPGVDGEVYDSAIYDDGTGAALYIAGDFDSASGLLASNIARWNGGAWEAVGGGISGNFGLPVRALEVFDPLDGSGPGLYAAGFFDQADGVTVQNVARYDGNGWSTGGVGLNGPVEDLVVFDGGSGPALYAGGTFFVGASFEDRGFARLEGDTWLAAPITFSGNVNELEVFDSPQGPRLVLAGTFFSASGLTQNRLAQWDGSVWSDVGGVAQLPASIALQAFDDGSGERLFLTGAGAPMQAWDGAQWSVVWADAQLSAQHLTVRPNVQGEELFALLDDSTSSVVSPARWTGSDWEVFPGGAFGFPHGLMPLAGLDGDGFLVFGFFLSVEVGAVDLPVRSVARWSPSEGWSAYGEPELGIAVEAQTLFDDGSGHGPELHVAGSLTAQGAASSLLRRRDGSWETLVERSGGTIETLEVFDWDGDGVEELIAGGSFTDLDSVPMAHLAAYDGAGWQELGGGTDKPVRALYVFEDGADFTEPTLFVAGDFDEANGELHKRVTYWTGSGWGHLGNNGNWEITSSVRAMAAFDRGSGTELYITGDFDVADGAFVRSFARWSGEAWRAVGGAQSFGLHFGSGADLEVHDDGNGDVLYVAGSFTAAGSANFGTRRIARTNGFAWFAVGEGFNNSVADIEVHDDGVNGPRLVACGGFSSIGQGPGAVPSNALAIWDGAAWSPFEGELESLGRSLLSLEPGLLPIDGLLVGGEFRYSPAGDSQLARWGSAVAEFESKLGCGAVAPRLTAGVGELAPGGSFQVFVTGAASPSATLSLYAGASLPGDCGLVLPGLGELLLELAPFPSLVASGAIDAGFGSVQVDVPAEPALAGQTAALQGLLLDLSGIGPAAELSTGLVGTL